MNKKKLTAGDNIEARCTRCRTVLNHTIVAMVGERVVRVECNTCRGVHNYIAEKTAAAPLPRTVTRKSATSPTPAKVKKDPAELERAEWESLLAALEGKAALPYDMNARYRVNDLVEHPAFGRGIVRLLAGPNKIQVLFQSGKKLLRCQ